MAIYKDECVYTFDNQYSPCGVDVCLQCFIGTSPDPAHDFTAAHSHQTGHTAFLNIRRVPKPKPSEELGIVEATEPQPKRLHIREEDGEPDYTETTMFKTLSHDNEAQFSSQVAKVLSADSYTKTKQTEEWQLELEPCEHVAIFESLFDDSVTHRMSGDQLSHCSDCELTSNLWLCLKCGNLGCGRRQFDGSGGNGHALSHFEQHGEDHALAVKLGSITPEGHVDVYCYACNDDKLDPNVAKHLAYWGIDIAKQTKTEKSMTELQLEQNMNWDFTGSDGGELVHGPGFTGMKNLGNSCYMNSVVQSLFDIPEFAQKFPPNDPGSRDLGGPEDLATQLNKMRDGLLSGRYDVVSPQMLKSLVGKDHAEFAMARQQDAFEYFTHFLSLISAIPKSSTSDKVREMPADVFGFTTERRIMCKNCNAVRYIDEDQENLSISVPIEENEKGEFRSVSFIELMNIFTNEEDIESKCPRCKSSQAVSNMKFKTFPVVLVVNVRRFRIVNWVPQKVDVPVTVSSKINLDHFISSGPQKDEDILTSEEVAELEAAELQSNQYTPDEEAVTMLVSMGFDYDLSVAALRLANERGMPESNLEPIIDLIVGGEAATFAASAAKPRNANQNVDSESLGMLESMGFDSSQATMALIHNNGNVEAAVEWLFAGKWEEAVQAQQKSVSRSSSPTVRGDAALPADYELRSTICHKGASVHVGHYVAAIHKGGENYLFNDERVLKGSNADELQKFAYIYMFHKL